VNRSEYLRETAIIQLPAVSLAAALTISESWEFASLHNYPDSGEIDFIMGAREPGAA
jgi:hypothetical protein